MLKRILLTLVLLLIIAYLAVAITVFNHKPAGQVCRDIELLVTDSVNEGFVTKQEITLLLKKRGMNPIGREMELVRTQAIEQELSKHSLIDQVECYKTLRGNLCIEVKQRIPILRVMSDNGEDYYVDNKGTVMAPDVKCVAQVAVVTGHVSKAFARGALYHFALFLQQNPFWDAQIEQIHVLPDNHVELIPRVGNHIIYMGKLVDYENKLKRVKLFYAQALNKVGWNRYSRINVEFGNQIICTKREGKTGG